MRRRWWHWWSWWLVGWLARGAWGWCGDVIGTMMIHRLGSNDEAMVVEWVMIYYDGDDGN